jgi:hypothetical protein
VRKSSRGKWGLLPYLPPSLSPTRFKSGNGLKTKESRFGDFENTEPTKIFEMIKHTKSELQKH